MAEAKEEPIDLAKMENIKQLIDLLPAEDLNTIIDMDALSAAVKRMNLEDQGQRPKGGNVPGEKELDGGGGGEGSGTTGETEVSGQAFRIVDKDKIAKKVQHKRSDNSYYFFLTLNLPDQQTGKDIYEEVASKCGLNVSEFSLYWEEVGKNQAEQKVYAVNPKSRGCPTFADRHGNDTPTNYVTDNIQYALLNDEDQINLTQASGRNYRYKMRMIKKV